MNKVIFFYDQEFQRYDFGQGHPMRGDRYPKAMNEFENLELLKQMEIKKPIIISEDILTFFHTPEYVDLVKRVNDAGQGYIGNEVPYFKDIFEIAKLSVSATISGADALIEKDYKIAINICGGWHHAFADQGRGFCIFNDIAIAAYYLLKEKNIKKIMILDYDAHHGDGTQIAFYTNSQVYTISFHQDPETLYPFLTGYENETGEAQGKGYNKNFPLYAYCDDEKFITSFNEFSEIIEKFKPEILILQMGVDGSKECRISSMQLTEKSYNYASGQIMDLQKRLKFKLLALGGGGFVHPMLGRHWGAQIKNFLNK